MFKFKIFFLNILFFYTIFFISGVYAEIVVTDDEGNIVRLNKPANRIISLSPHITEVLFSAGAGSKIIGAALYSDYPKEAKKIFRVSAYPSLDIESIVSLKPDLVIVWGSSSANNNIQIEKLLKFGLNVFVSEPRKPIDIYKTIIRFGKLADTRVIAEQSAKKFITRYRYLKEKFSKKEKVNVFYQFWNRPLLTINGNHLISNIIDLCGGTNIFKDLYSLTPKVSIESVIARSTDVIIAGGEEDKKFLWMSEWKVWLDMMSENKVKMYFIKPDHISRMGPRILQGAEKMCEILDKVRNK